MALGSDSSHLREALAFHRHSHEHRNERGSPFEREERGKRLSWRSAWQKPGVCIGVTNFLPEALTRQFFCLFSFFFAPFWFLSCLCDFFFVVLFFLPSSSGTTFGGAPSAFSEPIALQERCTEAEGYGQKRAGRPKAKGEVTRCGAPLLHCPFCAN